MNATARVRLAVRILGLERLDAGRASGSGSARSRRPERRSPSSVGADAVGDHGGLHGALRAGRARPRSTSSARPSTSDGVERPVGERGVGRRRGRRPALRVDRRVPCAVARLHDQRARAASDALPEQPEVERRRAAAPVRAIRMNTGEHGQRDRGRDHESLVAQAVPEVALRDEPPRPAVGRVGRAVDSRRHRLAEQLGQRRALPAEVRDVAGGPREVEHPLLVDVVVQLEHDGPSFGASSTRRTPGDRVVPLVGARPRPRHAQPPALARRAQLLDRAAPRRSGRGRSARRGRRAARPARADGSRTRPGTPRAPRLRTQHAGQRVHADGIEARRTARPGPARRADGRAPPRAARAAGCRARAFSTRSLARSATPSTSIDSAAAARGVGPREPVQPREVDQLLAAPSSSGTGRAPPACSRTAGAPRRRRGRPCQRTSPASGSSTPSAIRIVVVLPAPFGPTNPTISPSGTANDDAVERDDVAEASREVDQLEHDSV